MRTKQHKSKVAHIIFGIIIVFIALFAVMFLTNPKDKFSHYSAMQKSLEEDIAPVLVDVIKMEASESGNYNDNTSMAALTLFENLFKTNLGSSFIANQIEDRISIDYVENYYFFTLGYTGGDEVITIGLLGNVWTVFDFMTKGQIATKIIELRNNN